MVGSASRSSFLFEHDLFGKPASTFPDHALTRELSNYFRRRAGGTPISASKATLNAASSPRASAPPLAASTRPPMPASFGNLENPPTQPHAASLVSKSSASQRSAPRPRTNTLPAAR